MEQTRNSSHDPRLPEELIEVTLHAVQELRSSRRRRHDGWTAERICAFLDSLSRGGSATAAAAAAGMSRKSAYALRASDKGRAFARAWTVATRLARRIPPGGARSKVLHGRVTPIVRNGRLWGHRHRHDNRLAMAALTGLDRRLGHDGAEAVMAEAFDAMLDLIGRGDEQGLEALGRARCGHVPWESER